LNFLLIVGSTWRDATKTISVKMMRKIRRLRCPNKRKMILLCKLSNLETWNWLRRCFRSRPSLHMRKMGGTHFYGLPVTVMSRWLDF